MHFQLEAMFFFFAKGERVHHAAQALEKAADFVLFAQ
jgi:hypothetical protein